MRNPDKWVLRPEEWALGTLLLLGLALHVYLDLPYAPGVWVRAEIANDARIMSLISTGVFAVAIAVGLLLASRTLRQALLRPARALRDFLPMLLMPLIYETLHSLGPKLHGRVYDLVLMKVDYLLFKSVVFQDLPIGLLQTPIARSITFSFAFCYGAIFIVYGALGVYLYGCFEARVFRKYMLSIVATSCIGYLGYLLLPCVGPYEGLLRPGIVDFESGAPVEKFEAITAFSNQIRTMHFDQLPASDAFPSLHTAWALVVLGFAWRYVRMLYSLLLVWAFGTIMGALFLQQHYLTDVVFGLAAAFAGTAIATRIVDGRVNWTTTEMVISNPNMSSAS